MVDPVQAKLISDEQIYVYICEVFPNALTQTSSPFAIYRTKIYGKQSANDPSSP